MKTRPSNRAPIGPLSRARASGERVRSGLGSGGRLNAGTQGGSSLDNAKIEAAYIGYHKTLNDRLQSSKALAIYNFLATIAETDNLIDRNVWISTVPKMRRWLGDKVLNKLRAEMWPIVTGPHEASIEVPKHDILNDKLGLYSESIGRMGDAYNWSIDDHMIAYLVAGLQGTALGTTYDGQNLIDTDHTYLSVGGTAQSNKVTGALSAATFNQAIVKFMNLADENGTPLNIAGRPLTLVAGPYWRTTIKQFLDAEFLAAGASNTDKGAANYVITPWLSPRTTIVDGVSVTITGTEWFLMPQGSTSIIVQKKRGPEFLSVEEGEFAFRTGKYLYGIEAEFGLGYGLWQEIVGGPGS